MRWTARRLCLIAVVLLAASIVAGVSIAAVVVATTRATPVEQCPCPK